MVTSARQDVREGLYTYFQTFKAANPTIIPGDVYKARPGSFPALPAMYVGNFGEAILTDAQVRQRTMTVMVVIVHNIIDAAETAQMKDDAVDAWVDFINDNVHLAGGIIEAVATQDTELDLSGTIYSVTVIQHRALVQEGRA